MRLPPFEYHAPDTLEKALKIKGQYGSSASVLAGGTDLVVNMKHGLVGPAAVISIKNLKELKGIDLHSDSLFIRSGATLAEIAENPAVREHFPILVRAVESIGAMGIQWFRGTIGGNLLLQPRCILYNQSRFWRHGKGSCHRTGGKECLALPGSESCQSICSGDTVPVLTALSATVTLAGNAGERIVPLSEFFTGKGESPYNVLPEELLVGIRIPLPWAPLSWSYQRYAARRAVDFPLANAAAVAITEKGKVEHFRLVISALGPAPVILREAETVMKGSQPTEETIDRVGDIAVKAAEGMVVENASASREYRIRLASGLARRAAREALGM